MSAIETEISKTLGSNIGLDPVEWAKQWEEERKAKDWQQLKDERKKAPLADPTLKAMRFNSSKRKWGMVNFKALEPMVEVLEFGAQKYARDNWKKGLDRREILESMQRHLAKMLDEYEEDKIVYDSESKLREIGHIMCNAMFYAYFEDQIKPKDNGTS
jgi:hypothetical protein